MSVVLGADRAAHGKAQGFPMAGEGGGDGGKEEEDKVYKKSIWTRFCVFLMCPRIVFARVSW